MAKPQTSDADFARRALMGDAANHALGVDDESLPTPDVIHCQEEDEMVASDAPSSDEVSLSNTQSKGGSIVPHI